MSFAFKPAVYLDGTLYPLPRPILSLRVQDAWDFEQLKVPLRDGDLLAGHSRQGVEIVMAGQFGSQGGELSLTEAAMFTTWEELRERLHVGAAAGKFEFFIYHDVASSVFRKFKQCSTVRLECDLSSQTLFEYGLVVHADDPVVYTTGPGL